MIEQPLSILAVGPDRTWWEVVQPHGWVVVVSFLVAVTLTPVARAVAMKLRIVDKPDDFLKPHGRPIAYLGGLAILAGWLARMLVVRYPNWDALRWAIGLSLGGIVASGIGLADDILNVRPRTKLLGQVLAAVVLLSFGIGTHFARVFLFPFNPPEWLVVAASVPCTVLLVIAACNATNLLDGMDGLCSGVTGIIAIGFLVLSGHLAMYPLTEVPTALKESHDLVRIVASLAMFGAVMGFLPYNAPPARIFMGDAGSMLLGFFAAAMMLLFGERGIPRWVLASGMIFALPILDTSLAMIRRIRLRRPIFGGDRSHLYDQLIDRGFSVRKTLAIMYSLAGFYVLVGLLAIPVQTRYALPIYLTVAAATYLLCWKWGFLWPANERRPGGAPPAEKGSGS